MFLVPLPINWRLISKANEEYSAFFQSGASSRPNFFRYRVYFVIRFLYEFTFNFVIINDFIRK